ncbi:hypothetical protein [Sulfitobacter sp. JB4-11]|uniref:hypothetical protein n=1 Tax=Sulfitobacter rhodophyticola TaxID=3238304 RepID=UPI003D81BABC
MHRAALGIALAELSARCLTLTTSTAKSAGIAAAICEPALSRTALLTAETTLSRAAETTLPGGCADPTKSLLLSAKSALSCGLTLLSGTPTALTLLACAKSTVLRLTAKRAALTKSATTAKITRIGAKSAPSHAALHSGSKSTLTAETDTSAAGVTIAQWFRNGSRFAFWPAVFCRIVHCRHPPDNFG